MSEASVLTLSNDTLSAEIRLPGSESASERFDSAAVVQQIILHGRHRFGQPEQYIRDRVTCYGFGLCAEFDMNDAGTEAMAGDFFPKPGVGLMKQLKDRLPYNMWQHYEIRRFPKRWEHGADWIVFHEEPIACLGIALEIVRKLQLDRNRIILSTSVRNAGSRAVSFSEYQHNFVAVDDLPVGDGYCLELPFDGTIQDLPDRCRTLPDFRPAAGFIRVEGQKAFWQGKVLNQTWHKTTERDQILPCERYRWTLSHRDSEASVSEQCSFRPSKLVLWGVEHCICTEVYHDIRLEPGETDIYTRTWTFEDDETRRNEQ